MTEINKGDFVTVLKNQSCAIIGQKCEVVSIYTRHEGCWLYVVKGYWSDRDSPIPTLGSITLFRSEIEKVK